MTTDKPLYLCKLCNTVTPKPSHHKMTSCKCGAISVDHGWYGSKVVYDLPPGKSFEDCFEVAPEEALSCATCGVVFPDIASAVVDPCLCGVGGAPLTRLRDAAAGSSDQPKE